MLKTNSSEDDEFHRWVNQSFITLLFVVLTRKSNRLEKAEIDTVETCRLPEAETKWRQFFVFRFIYLLVSLTCTKYTYKPSNLAALQTVAVAASLL